MMNKASFLREGERLDDLQIKGYKVIQSPGRFCFGTDAVLLSSFAKVRRGERALDLGTGTGILPILLEAKNEGACYAGLEVQEESADMARRSVECNGLSDKVKIVTGDIKEAGRLFGAASFEVITVNPPYMPGDHGLKNDNSALYIARHEALCTLDDVLRESASLPVIVKPGRVRRLGGEVRRVFDQEAVCTELYALALPALETAESDYALSPAVAWGPEKEQNL